MSSKFSIIIIIVVLLVAGGFFYKNYFQRSQVLSSQEAGEKAVAYINENMLEKGTSASLINVKEKSGMYKIHFKIQEREHDAYVSKDGKFLFPQAIDLEKTSQVAGEQTEERPEYPKTIGDFLVLDKEECFEDEKPLVYFFGHTGCPHCKWEEPVMKKATDKFGDLIVFHNNMDSQEGREIFDEYSAINQGGVPFLVLGCKYVRVGSGEQVGEEEIKVLTAIICQLTDGAPKEVCGEMEAVDD